MDTNDYFSMLLGLFPDEYFKVSNDKYFMDPEVTDCQFKLYMVLLVNEDSPKTEKLINEFVEAYKKLPKEKQNFIRDDLYRILNEQDKNNKEKEKRL